MILVVEYPATFCACPLEARQWNGYGTCQRCGGAYKAKGPLAPIVVPRTGEQPA